MSKSDIRRPITSKRQNKDSKYAGNKIFVLYGILSLLFIPYFHGNSILENNVVFAQPNPSTSDPLTDRSPSFLEAYWTDNSGSTSSSSTSSNNSIKKEVGPEEGASTLAIVLVNKGRSEITALTGYLTLPSSGFGSIEGENLVNSSNISVASHDSTVKPGEIFTLHFTIDVLNDARVGAYSGLLKLVYSKVLEVGQISSSIAVPFRITGKVVLDAVSNTQNLDAGSPNDLRILIRNEGSADASGVIATVTDVSDGTTTSAVSNSNSNDAGNNGSTRNDSDSDNNATASTSTDEATTEDGQEADSEAPTISLQTTTFNVGNIPAGRSAFITPTVYPSYSSGGTIQNLDLEISYNDAYGTKTTTDKSIGIVISPNPPESVLSISPFNTTTTSNLGNASSVNNEDNTGGQDSILLKAGKIEEVTFLVSNNGDTPLKDVVLSLDSSLDSVKILGDSRWTFSSMDASSKQELSTQVFAAEDVIATPIEFTVDAEYISGGQSKTDTLSIGAYVDGEIKIKAYDFAVNDIGGTPNLVGNLLNQGNTIALFTTVEMINTGQANTSTSSSSTTTTKQLPRALVSDFPPQQYLGDLSENSPLPFSIPLNIDKGLPKGTYPVSIRVTYTDNLRNTHELVLNGTVNYTPKSTDSTTESGGFLGSGELSSSIVPVVIILAIISILAIVVRRRRKGGKGKTFNSNNADLELFDDKSSSAENKRENGVKQ
ncbi:MAG: COG1361 S-layer family protein [Nitrososphaeraceae archaeon]